MSDAAAQAADRRRGEFLILAAAAIFATGGVVLKAPDLSHWQVAGGRTGVAAVAMLLMVPAARRGWDRRTLLVGLPYAATLLLFAFSTRLTTAAHAIFLQSTAPLFLLALSPWLLGERPRRRDLVYMGVLAAGLVLVFSGRGEPAVTAPDPALGNALGLASGLTWALGVAGLRWLAKDDPTGGRAAGATVAGNVIAFAVSLPFALSSDVPLSGAAAGDWLAILYLGAVQVALAYTCLVHGMRRVPAFEASLLLLLEPVLNPVFAWIVRGEDPGPWALAGGAVIVVATAVHTRR